MGFLTGASEQDLGQPRFLPFRKEALEQLVSNLQLGSKSSSIETSASPSPRRAEIPIWLFPKIRGPILVVPIVRTIIFGFVVGPPIYGSPHIITATRHGFAASSPDDKVRALAHLDLQRRLSLQAPGPRELFEFGWTQGFDWNIGAQCIGPKRFSSIILRYASVDG